MCQLTVALGTLLAYSRGRPDSDTLVALSSDEFTQALEEESGIEIAVTHAGKSCKTLKGAFKTAGCCTAADRATRTGEVKWRALWSSARVDDPAAVGENGGG